MAETHEPSYYEIALTNRQVVVAFVILLTCLVAAFFSGVWIGREATARAAQEQIVRNTPPPQDAEGKNLEELEFFDPKAKKDHKDHKKAAAAAGQASSAGQDAVEKPVPGASPPTQAAQPARKATLADELAGRRTGTPAKREPPQPVAETPAAATPRPAAAAKRAAPAPAADEAADETPAPAPKKTAKAHDRTAAAGGGGGGKGAYVIQVFSSADKAQADRIRAKLAGGGQKAFLSPIERGGRTMYRVRVGPFKSRDDAQKTADKVRKAYRLDTWVTE